MKRVVTTKDATGNVVCEWRGGDEQTLPPRVGYTHRAVPVDDPDHSGHRWNGTAFEPVVVAVRVLSRLDFARLFTQAEDIAIEDSVDSAVKFLRRRLNMAQTVNLDHLDVVNGTSLLVSNGLLTAARRTAILAGTPPS